MHYLQLGLVHVLLVACEVKHCASCQILFFRITILICSQIMSSLWPNHDCFYLFLLSPYRFFVVDDKWIIRSSFSSSDYVVRCMMWLPVDALKDRTTSWQNHILSFFRKSNYFKIWHIDKSRSARARAPLRYMLMLCTSADTLFTGRSFLSLLLLQYIPFRVADTSRVAEVWVRTFFILLFLFFFVLVCHWYKWNSCWAVVGLRCEHK